MSSIRSFSLLALLALSVAGIGCGKSGIYPIEGVVLLDGSPLGGATVTCQPQGSGQPAFATTKADGSFKVATPAGKGATPGEYKLSLSKVSGRKREGPPPWVGRVGVPVTRAEILAWEKKLADDRKKEHEAVPEPYRTTATTPLSITVPLDQDLVIELTSTSPPSKP
ncbi:MAG: hypothetical protein JWN70_6769 [Planctomycetaceae bacterium]|nr:hypothetical protein [Planctomycetaceae bacterium]